MFTLATGSIVSLFQDYRIDSTENTRGNRNIERIIGKIFSELTGYYNSKY